MRARKTRERDTVRDGHREAGKGGLALLQACWDAFKRAECIPVCPFAGVVVERFRHGLGGPGKVYRRAPVERRCVACACVDACGWMDRVDVCV